MEKTLEAGEPETVYLRAVRSALPSNLRVALRDITAQAVKPPESVRWKADDQLCIWQKSRLSTVPRLPFGISCDGV